MSVAIPAEVYRVIAGVLNRLVCHKADEGSPTSSSECAMTTATIRMAFLHRATTLD